MARLHVVGASMDAVLILLAIFVAGLLGLSISIIIYSLLAVFVVFVLDVAIRVRRTVAYTLGMKLGNTQREIQELRESLEKERRERGAAVKVVRAVQDEPLSQSPVVTETYVPDDKLAHHQQGITDALLIFDTAMSGKSFSRESMTPGTLSQDRWFLGKEYLVGAGVLKYKTHKSTEWATTDRNVARGMLLLYAKRAVVTR